MYKYISNSIEDTMAIAKKLASKLNISDIIVLTGQIGAGKTYFTKGMESRFKQFMIQTASAITLTILTSLGMSKYADTEQKNLLNKHNAKEIFYKA